MIAYDVLPLSETRQLREFRSDPEIWDLYRWPSRKPSLEEIYWLAGVFGGEAAFVQRGTICIYQEDREILDRVRVLLGGRVALRRREPYIHYWHASGPRARGVIRTLYPLLSARRQAQARRFLHISRGQAEPKLDPRDPTRYLWDWLPTGSDEVE